MSTPHLPADVPRPPRPQAVVPLLADLGVAGGHRLTLLSVELYDGWADLRFVRVDEGADRPLPRRVPPTSAWRIASGGQRLEVLDAVGRGDREFSNGEVRLRPAPALEAPLDVVVELVGDQPPLRTRTELTADRGATRE